MISPTGPRYPTAASDGGGPDNIWGTPSNIFAEDASVSQVVFPGGGDGSNVLYSSGYGFSIPSTALITGIKVEYKRSGINAAIGGMLLTKAGVQVGTVKADVADGYPDTFVTGLQWYTYGGDGDLWGTTWTPTEINASGFGVTVSAYNTHGGGSANIDAIRVTVYWRTAPADVPKRYLYKIFSAGQYLGNLPNVISEFNPSQDINSAGSSLAIECAVSADTSREAPLVLTDEADNILTDESSSNLTNEFTSPPVALGPDTSGALIKNGNLIEVWEYSYYYPNGKCMFLGEIEDWEAGFGGEDGDTVKIQTYSDGQDMDNYLVRGNPYTYTGDVTQSSQNASVTVSQAGMGASWDRFGQTWKVGAGVTNLGAISLLLSGTADVSIDVYAGPGLGTLLGTTTKNVSVGTPTEVQFGFPATITTTPLATLFFIVRVEAGQSIALYYQNTNVYANGAMYESAYGGGGGGAYGVVGVGDLYFKTFSGTGSTIGTFTSQDPSTGMLKTFMDDYTARSGVIGYTADSIQATGLSLTYSFNTNTIYEGVKAVQEMAPSGFYHYVDLGTNILYMKRASTTADLVLVKGRDIERLKLGASITQVKNSIYFTGGPTAGVNLYRSYNDPTSIGLYRTRLDRKTDNRVTVAATADAIGGSARDDQKDEKYRTTVSVLDRQMDITLFKPGMVLGFAGFGTFVDRLLLQVVRIEYSPSRVVLTLGALPIRLSDEFDQVTRGLLAQQTLANPTSPS